MFPFSPVTPTRPSFSMNKNPVSAAIPGMVTCIVASPGSRAVIVPSSLILILSEPLVTSKVGSTLLSGYSLTKLVKDFPSGVCNSILVVSPTASLFPPGSIAATFW